MISPDGTAADYFGAMAKDYDSLVHRAVPSALSKRRQQ